MLTETKGPNLEYTPEGTAKIQRIQDRYERRGGAVSVAGRQPASSFGAGNLYLDGAVAHMFVGLRAQRTAPKPEGPQTCITAREVMLRMGYTSERIDELWAIVLKKRKAAARKNGKGKGKGRGSKR